MQDEILRIKWAEANDICAVHIKFFEPTQDGDFEILFVPPQEAEKMESEPYDFGHVYIVSLGEGIDLAKQDGCNGGLSELEELRRVLEIRPDLRPGGLDL